MTLAAAIAATIVISGAWYLLDDSGEDANSVPTYGLTWVSETGLRFVLDNPMLLDTNWSDVKIVLVATPINSDPYEMAYWTWYPSYQNLTSQDGQPITYSMQDYWGVPTDVQMFCNLTDISGNGIVDEGDSFMLTPMTGNSDVTGIPCCLRLVYMPMAGAMCTLEFTP